MKRLLLTAALAALVVPGVAAAHAILLQTSPADGAVLARSPREIRVTFDDAIQLGSGSAAVANADGASILSARPRVAGHSLILPLRPGLPSGAYSVRWSIVAEDGHREEGVLAFAVGSGAAAPFSILGSGAGLSWTDVALRALYLLGALTAAGGFAFWLLMRRLFAGGLDRRVARLLFFGLFCAFVGTGGLVQTTAAGTRFAHSVEIAAIVAAAGAASAALAVSRPALLAIAGSCAVTLAAIPAFAGHALDRGSTRWFAIPADLLHLASAAVWIGGLAALLSVLAGGVGDETARLAATRRFSTVALVAVGVLGASGLARSLSELNSVSQVWSTSYGRALIVKTAVFLPLLAVGRLNRLRLERGSPELRRPVQLELAGLVAIVAVVGVLTDLRPGSEAPPAPKPVLQKTATLSRAGDYSRVDVPAAGSTASR
jgi:copper transport protein